MVDLFRKLIVAAALTALNCSVVNASVITEQFSFSGTYFGAPISPVTGSVTVTFDPNVSGGDTTAGITVDSLNLVLDSAIAFNYDSTGLGTMNIGGINNGIVTSMGGTNDFFLTILNVQTTPTFQQLYYAQGGSTFGTGIGSVTAAAVPEPATLALLGLGLAGMGLIRRKRTA